MNHGASSSEPTDLIREQTLTRAGGVVLVTGSLAFMAVFAHLASVLGYPDVLDRPAEDVLPALLAGGRALRGVWVLYGLLPLCFFVAGVATHPLMRRTGESLAHVGRTAATVSAAAMMLGLLRWPSIQWNLAERWSSAGTVERASLSAIFDAANIYLGNYLGELVGEVSLYAWYVVMGLALRAGAPRERHVGTFVLASAAVGLVAALRNVTPLVAPVAEVNDLLLPVSLIVIGAGLMKR